MSDGLMVEAIILTRTQPDGGESDEKMGEFALETEGDPNSILTREWDLDYHKYACLLNTMGNLEFY